MMNSLFYKDHLHYGWGRKTFNIKSPKGKYWINYGKAEYTPTNFKQELFRAVSLIVKQNNKPIVVHASGGIDSEVVCLVLTELKIPYTISLMHICDGDNKHINSNETYYIYKFIKKYNIPFVVHTIDINEYIQNSFLEDAHRYKTYRLGMLLQGELIKFFPNHLNLYGDGRFSVSRYRDLGIDKPGTILVDDIGLMHTYFKAAELGISAIRRVFMFTPELMLSYLLDYDVNHWIKYADSFYGKYEKFGNLNCEQIKRYMTFRHWPELETRPKFTGLENAKFLNEKNPKNPCFKIWLEINNLYNTKKGLVYCSYETNALLDRLKPIKG